MGRVLEGRAWGVGDVAPYFYYPDARLTTPNNQNSRLIETLRHALQRERGSFSNCPTGGTPIRPLFPWFGSEVGT
jgi:hypothetical protein